MAMVHPTPPMPPPTTTLAPVTATTTPAPVIVAPPVTVPVPVVTLPPTTVPSVPAVPVPAPVTGPAPASGDMGSAKALIASGKKYEARALLTKPILAAPEGPGREEIHRMLDEINTELFFSRNPSPDSQMYLVQGGDSFSLIAKKNGKDMYFGELIMQINGISDPRRLVAGKKLKVPQGQFSVRVEKHAHRLIVLLNGEHYIKEYTVALGAPATPTPAAKFTIGAKQKDPDWYSKDGVLKFGDPKNPLGTRWIGFVDTPDYQSFGIHGTIEPDTVGQDVSNGCVRMKNEDVEQLFGMLMTGDTVEIVP
jgi:LysM repeat protein